MSTATTAPSPVLPAAPPPRADPASAPGPSIVVAALRDVPAGGDDSPLTTARALMVCLGGAALFGIALGSFGGSLTQMVASGLKTPMLLLGTTALCFPALFIMQLTRAPRPLSLRRALSLTALSLAATALWWGALALPLLFLASTVQHYRLAQGLALLVGATGGAAGLWRFWRRFSAEVQLAAGPAPHGALAAYFVLYGVVGAQLSWFLRPFVGEPGQPFALFRGLDSNFFAFLLGPLWSA